MSNKFRHEIKHYINIADYITLKQRLKFIAKQDSHVDDTGTYRIRSLYFDNADDKALREKIEGINNREKFRIRYYNDDYSYIKLEKKSKINGLCTKRSARLSREQCESIINGDIAWLKEAQDPLLIELYTKMNNQQLKPKTLVDYVREPYIYEPGNVRITIDSEIRTGLYSRDLFNENVSMLAAAPKNILILEVKFDEFLPGIIQDIVQVSNRRSAAVSKYAVCRTFG